MIRIVENSSDAIRQLLPNIGTYLDGDVNKWEIWHYNPQTRSDYWKYVGTDNNTVYVFGGTLQTFVCDGRGCKTEPTGKKAHLSMSIEEWQKVLERGIQLIEFIAKDVRHSFVIDTDSAQEYGHAYNTLNGARWLIELKAFDEIGLNGRIIRKGERNKAKQPALI